MINQAVSPSGDSALHLAGLKLAISPNVGNSGAQFLLVGGLRKRNPLLTIEHYYAVTPLFTVLDV